MNTKMPLLHHLTAACALLLLVPAGCSNSEDTRPAYPVQLRLGGALPPEGRVGDYTVTFTEGTVVLGDWWIYGMDREAAGYAALLKHAGHAHGEADTEVHVDGTFAVDLLAEPSVIAQPDLTEGHYFDGSIRLRPATEIYAPVHVEDLAAVSPTEAIWGHSLLLSGTATKDGSEIYDFRITIDAEAMIAGLIYGGTVWESGTTVITTRLKLGALLADVDFAALANAEGQVNISATSGEDEYSLIKARLQDPTLYVHAEAEEVLQ